MDAALAEFEARLSDIEGQLNFVASASRLRPRLNGVVRWEAGGDETALAADFMRQKDARPEGLYAALLVRTLGALERFVRKCVSESVNRQAAASKTYESLADPLRRRHLVLSGRLLATLDTPSDSVAFSPADLVARLSTCRDGATDFKLNAISFEAVVTGANPSVVEKAFENIGRSDLWDRVGTVPGVDSVLGCGGAGPRETGKRAHERLRDLWKWRNSIAHAGDSEVVVSERECREHIAFARVFGRALEAVARGTS